MSTHPKAKPRFHQLATLVAVLLLGTGCAIYPKIGPAAKPVENDTLLGKWKISQFDFKVRCRRLPSKTPEYRISDARFWASLFGLGILERNLVFYQIRHQLWYETYAPPGSAEANSRPMDETVDVGLVRFVGTDKFYLRPLSSTWVRDYAMSYPKVLPYKSVSKDSNDVIITASPERWYWFLENKVRYPESFGTPWVFYRVK
ncbi:MAG TPA: hypothetical protein VGM54_02355 [Chthoniobacter sp.]|jgi:hypothetical protein